MAPETITEDSNSESETSATQNPPRMPTTYTYTNPSTHLYLPKITSEGAPGHFGDHTLHTPISYPARARLTPQTFSPPPDAPPLPIPIPPPLPPATIPPALQHAIVKEIQKAVNNAMKAVQEDTIKIMEEYMERRGEMEKERAVRWEEWFTGRLEGMDRRIRGQERGGHGDDGESNTSRPGQVRDAVRGEVDEERGDDTVVDQGRESRREERSVPEKPKLVSLTSS